MAISLGDRIGDYEVTGTLGVGGMGEVYRVRHTISHRIEAMKVLLPGRPDAQEIAERFLREIRLLASLDHPNIAAFHTAFRHQGELVMIMEFVEGQTIRPQFSGNAIIVDRSLDHIKQVLTGLAYAQRMLSTPARALRRRTSNVDCVITRHDGTRHVLDRAALLAPLEAALKTMSITMPMLAIALLLARTNG